MNKKGMELAWNIIFMVILGLIVLGIVSYKFIIGAGEAQKEWEAKPCPLCTSQTPKGECENPSVGNYRVKEGYECCPEGTEIEAKRYFDQAEKERDLEQSIMLYEFAELECPSSPVGARSLLMQGKQYLQLAKKLEGNEAKQGGRKDYLDNAEESFRKLITDYDGYVNNVDEEVFSAKVGLMYTYSSYAQYFGQTKLSGLSDLIGKLDLGDDTSSALKSYFDALTEPDDAAKFVKLKSLTEDFKELSLGDFERSTFLMSLFKEMHLTIADNLFPEAIEKGVETDFDSGKDIMYNFLDKTASSEVYSDETKREAFFKLTKGVKDYHTSALAKESDTEQKLKVLDKYYFDLEELYDKSDDYEFITTYERADILAEIGQVGEKGIPLVTNTDDAKKHYRRAFDAYDQSGDLYESELDEDYSASDNEKIQQSRDDSEGRMRAMCQSIVDSGWQEDLRSIYRRYCPDLGFEI